MPRNKSSFSRRALPACLLALTTLATAAVAQTAHPSQIIIPGERIIPESLTSTADGTVIIGSVGTGAIFRAGPGVVMAGPWVQPGTDGLQGVFGVLADESANTLWACSGAFGAPQGETPSPSALHAFDLASGAPKGRYELPTAGGFCNDIAVAADGTVYATDTNNMAVVRLNTDSQALEVWSAEGAFGPAGGVLDGIAIVEGRVVVNTLATSKLFAVTVGPDSSAGAVAELILDRAIERPDGMRTFGANGLLVVEGGGSGRLSRVVLSGDKGQVTTLNEGYPDGPVAVTVVGTTAYVLEAQFASLRATDAELKPFKASAVEVGAP